MSTLDKLVFPSSFTDSKLGVFKWWLGRVHQQLRSCLSFPGIFFQI